MINFFFGDLFLSLRLVVSGHLQKENEFFASFIEGGRSVKEFCNQVLYHVHYMQH